VAQERRSRVRAPAVTLPDTRPPQRLAYYPSRATTARWRSRLNGYTVRLGDTPSVQHERRA
jgi:hypothetical protein